MAAHTATTTTATTAEQDVRAFAVQFPTPNVLAALGHCETGRLSWEAVAALFAKSTAKALRSL